MTKIRTITLTGRPPVKINEDMWPLISHGYDYWHDGLILEEANRNRKIDIRVRQHADGRTLVYGVYYYSSNFQHEPDETHRVGMLLDAGTEIPAAITAVMEMLLTRVSEGDMHRHICHVADECIAALPAQTLN